MAEDGQRGLYIQKNTYENQQARKKFKQLLSQVSDKKCNDILLTPPQGRPHTEGDWNTVSLTPICL